MSLIKFTAQCALRIVFSRSRDEPTQEQSVLDDVGPDDEYRVRNEVCDEFHSAGKGCHPPKPLIGANRALRGDYSSYRLIEGCFVAALGDGATTSKLEALIKHVAPPSRGVCIKQYTGARWLLTSCLSKLGWLVIVRLERDLAENCNGWVSNYNTAAISERCR